MRFIYLVILLSSSRLSAQTVGTNTQYVLKYSCSGASSVVVSQVGDGINPSSCPNPLTNPVFDTNETIFPGSSSCTGTDRCPPDPGVSSTHYFVVGTKVAQRGTDGFNHSRALPANANFCAQVTCSGSPQTPTVFQTSTVALGETHLDPVPPSTDITGKTAQTYSGWYGYPDFTRWSESDPTARTETIVDPQFGTTIKRLTMPDDLGRPPDDVNFVVASGASWSASDAGTLIHAISTDDSVYVTNSTTSDWLISSINLQMNGKQGGSDTGTDSTVEKMVASLKAWYTGSPHNVEVALSIDGINVWPDSSNVYTIALGSSALPSTFATYGDGSQSMYPWTNVSLGFPPLQSGDMSYRSGNVTVDSGGVVSWIVDGSSRSRFRPTWSVGTPITIGGALCTISAYTNPERLTIVPASCSPALTVPITSPTPYHVNGVSLMIRRPAGVTDALNVQYAKFALSSGTGSSVQWVSGGEAKMWNDHLKLNSVTNHLGTLGVISGKAWWIDSITGVGNQIGPLQPPSQAGTDGWNFNSGGGCSINESFLGTAPTALESLYCIGHDNTTNKPVMLNCTLYNAAGSGVPSYQTGDSSLICTNMTKVSTGKDLLALMVAFTAGQASVFDPVLYQNFGLNATSLSAGYVFLKAQRGPQNSYGWEAMFDPLLISSAAGCVGGGLPGCIISAKDSWSSSPNRWDDIHSFDPQGVIGESTGHSMQCQPDSSFVPGIEYGWLGTTTGCDWFQVNIPGSSLPITPTIAAGTANSGTLCPIGSAGCDVVTVDGEPCALAQPANIPNNWPADTPNCPKDGTKIWLQNAQVGDVLMTGDAITTTNGSCCRNDFGKDFEIEFLRILDKRGSPWSSSMVQRGYSSNFATAGNGFTYVTKGTATTNSSGHTVHATNWFFSPGMVGGTIIINGVSLVVATYVDNTNITTTGDPGTNSSNVNWFWPHQSGASIPTYMGATGGFFNGPVPSLINGGLTYWDFTHDPHGQNNGGGNLTVVFEGDSITRGFGLSPSPDTTGACATTTTDHTCLDWGSQLVTTPGNYLFGAVSIKNNFATNGCTVPCIQARYTASVHPLSPAATGNKGILFVWIGTNDQLTDSAATIEANLTTYWAGAKADGWKLAVATITKRQSSTGGTEAVRAAVNTWIASQQGILYDWLIDTASVLPDNTSTTLFQSDQTHPTAIGQVSAANFANAATVFTVALSPLDYYDHGSFTYDTVTGLLQRVGATDSRDFSRPPNDGYAIFSGPALPVGAYAPTGHNSLSPPFHGTTGLTVFTEDAQPHISIGNVASHTFTDSRPIVGPGSETALNVGGNLYRMTGATLDGDTFVFFGWEFNNTCSTALQLDGTTIVTRLTGPNFTSALVNDNKSGAFYNYQVGNDTYRLLGSGITDTDHLVLTADKSPGTHAGPLPCNGGSAQGAGTSNPTLSQKAQPLQLWCGVQPIVDISSAATGDVIGTTTSDNNKGCVARRAGECRAASAQGDLYFNCQQTSPRTQGYSGTFGCTQFEPEGSSVNDMCAGNPGAYGNAAMESLIANDVTGASGRSLTHSLFRTTIEDSNNSVRTTADHNWLNAIAFSFPGSEFEVLTISIPPLPTPDGINRGDFVPVNISIPLAGTTIPGGATNVTVSFWYSEYGVGCTSRQEKCVTITSGSVPSNPPFLFETSDTYTRPAISVTSLTVPALSGKMLHYAVNYYTGGTLTRSDIGPPLPVAPAGFVQPPGCSITPTTLSNGTVGTSYSDVFVAASGCGVGPFTWSVLSGTLPAGLSICSAAGQTCSIAGTPTTATSYSFTIKVTDGGSNTATQLYSVTINNPSPCNITPTSLPNGAVGIGYSQTLTASSCGAGPFTWSVISGGLPNGVPFCSGATTTCTISGTPTTAAAYGFTIKVTDGGSNTATQAYSITINPSVSCSITPTTLPNGTVGTTYSGATTLTANGCGTTITWSVISGSLPAGLSLCVGTATSCTITGTPTTAANYNATIQISGTGTASQAYSITINPASTCNITPTSLPNGTAGISYSQALTANSCGGGPLTWAVISGSLPPGLTSCSAAGVGCLISGTPSLAGTYPFTIRVTDGGGVLVTWNGVTATWNSVNASWGTGGGSNTASNPYTVVVASSGPPPPAGTRWIIIP